MVFQKSIFHIILVIYIIFFELDREITGSILQNHKWSLKTRHRAVNSQRQKTGFF